MTTSQYTLIAFTVILTSLSFRARNILNNISQNISEDKVERNNYEVVMQPKWLLHSIWPLTILWIYLSYALFQTERWWSLIHVVVLYFSVLLFSKLLPFPSIGFFINLFHKTVTKRLSNESRFTFLELQYLRIVKGALDEIQTPKRERGK